MFVTVGVAVGVSVAAYATGPLADSMTVAITIASPTAAIMSRFMVHLLT